jgi:serine/threonine protein kinase
MTPERWQQVKEVLHKALELAPEQRPAFLQQSCSGDESLRRDVESLLASADQAGAGFLQSFTMHVALPKGSRLGDYEVQSLLGSGGMGEVYRAHDCRLDRDVAIKVLPRVFSSNPERLRRFEQEARAAAALNHPNILAVLQMGTHEGAPYLVSELLEGLTLREQLRRGPLPIRKAIDYAIQIAHGLAAAHDKGIVHRDLKPENLFVTKDGRIKVLDFGLAKLTQPKTASVPVTRTPDQQTESGMVMGTVGYMAPEQVRGEVVDRRADIFAFGAILYEMLSGKRAFQGQSAADTAAAVLNQEPASLSNIVPSIPSGLQRIVQRCLEKSADQRFHAAPDLAFALESLSGFTGPTSEVLEMGRLPHYWRWILAVGTLTVAGTFLTWYVLHRHASPGPAFRERQLTSNSSESPITAAAISPDGKYLAYVDDAGINLKLIDSGEMHLLPSPAGSRVDSLSWLPDGTRLLVGGWESENSSIWVISILGGVPRKLRDVASQPSPSPDGTQISFIANREQGIWIMRADGAQAHKVLAASGTDQVTLPQFMPGAQKIIYGKIHNVYEISGEVKAEITAETMDLQTGKTTVILSEPRVTSGIALPDGRLIYSLYDTPSIEASLWAIGTDAHLSRAANKPQRIAGWVRSVVNNLSVTADGRRIAFIKQTPQMDVYVGDLRANGRRLINSRRLTLDDREDRPAAWTADGKAVLFYSDRNGSFDIFKQALNQTTAEPIVAGPEDEIGPNAVSPDGKWYFYSVVPNLSQANLITPVTLMRVPADGGPPQAMFDRPQLAFVKCARKPSNSCVVVVLEPTHLDVYALDQAWGKGPLLRSFEIHSIRLYFDLSPDGSHIAVVWPGEQPGRIRQLSLTDGTSRDLMLTDWMRWGRIAWSADGKGWYTSRLSAGGTDLVYVDSEGHPVTLSHQLGHFDVWAIPSPDGQHLAFAQTNSSSNVWIAENF